MCKLAEILRRRTDNLKSTITRTKTELRKAYSDQSYHRVVEMERQLSIQENNLIAYETALSEAKLI
jgi:hypothetical protein